MNQKDKKLVWSLEETLKRNGQSPQDGETFELNDNVKIKSIDPNTDTLVYEYEIKGSKFDKAKADSFCKLPKWLIAIFIALGIAAIIGAIVALALKAATPITYSGLNQNCSDSSPCDPSKGQVCTNSLCACSNSTPVLIGDVCSALKDYLDTCSDSTQCDTSKNLTCLAGKCDCDSAGTSDLPFWSYTKQKCVYCPSSWTFDSSSTTAACYFLFPSTKTWLTARADCATYQGDLMSLSTQTKYENFTAMFIAKPVSYGTYIWIGAQCKPVSGVASCSFLDGTSLSTSSPKWCSSQVMPIAIGNDYVAATYSGGTNPCFIANTASTSYGYICEISKQLLLSTDSLSTLTI